VGEEKLDCSRTHVPPVLLRTTTVTSLSGAGSPVPHDSEGEVVNVSVEIGQLYSTKVSTR
jgi:hypothetical protein